MLPLKGMKKKRRGKSTIEEGVTDEEITWVGGGLWRRWREDEGQTLHEYFLFIYSLVVCVKREGGR